MYLNRRKVTRTATLGLKPKFGRRDQAQKWLGLAGAGAGQQVCGTGRLGELLRHKILVDAQKSICKAGQQIPRQFFLFKTCFECIKTDFFVVLKGEPEALAWTYDSNAHSYYNTTG